MDELDQIFVQFKIFNIFEWSITDRKSLVNDYQRYYYHYLNLIPQTTSYGGCLGKDTVNRSQHIIWWRFKHRLSSTVK